MIDDLDIYSPGISDMDLPGMWSQADYMGGAPDEVRGPDWTPPRETAFRAMDDHRRRRDRAIANDRRTRA